MCAREAVQSVDTRVQLCAGDTCVLRVCCCRRSHLGQCTLPTGVLGLAYPTIPSPHSEAQTCLQDLWARWTVGDRATGTVPA